jgi:hypothetical protein
LTQLARQDHPDERAVAGLLIGALGYQQHTIDRERTAIETLMEAQRRQEEFGRLMSTLGGMQRASRLVGSLKGGGGCAQEGEDRPDRRSGLNTAA